MYSYQMFLKSTTHYRVQEEGGNERFKDLALFPLEHRSEKPKIWLDLEAVRKINEQKKT